MTKQEKYQEINRMFYTFCEERGFSVSDEGFGDWVVTKNGSTHHSESFRVSRNTYHIPVQFTEDDKTLEFAKKLEVFLQDLQRMFEI